MILYTRLDVSKYMKGDKTYPMHVLRALDELLHIELDLADSELDTFILQQSSKIVIHVRKDHVDRQG